MTRIEKLYAKLLANPRSHYPFRDFEKLLIALGFEHDRTKGSHHIWVHRDHAFIMNIQKSGKDAKPYQVKQLLELIEQHGLYIAE